MRPSETPIGQPAKDQSASEGPASPRPPCPKAAGSVSCQHCVDFLLDYFEGTLPKDQRFTFDSHLAFCSDCAVYVQNYGKAMALTAGLALQRPSSLPGPVPTGLVEAILDASKVQRG